MAENMRNEVQINLGDPTPYTLRATWECLANLERDLNTNIIPLIRKFASQDIGLAQAALIIYHGLQGFGDTRLSVPQIGEKIMKVGLSSIQVQLINFLGIAMKGVDAGNPPAADAKA